MVGKKCMKDRSGLQFSEEDCSKAFNTVPSFLDGLDHMEVSVTDDCSSDDESNAFTPVVKELPSARSVMRGTWRVVLGLAAFLDCASTVLPGLLMVQSSCEKDDLASEGRTCSLGKLTIFSHDFTVSNPRLVELFAWLDQQAVYFGFAFSLLWCVQAFRDARDIRRKALRERDRKRLLNRGESIRALGNDDDLVKSGYFGGFRPWLAFYSTLIAQLFLVPVGFYALLYQGLRLLTTDSNAELHELVEHVGESSGDEQTFQAILNSTYQVVETSLENNLFNKDARLSVVVLLAKQAGNAFMNALGAKLKKWAVKKGFKEGRKLGVRAIVTPHKVWKQARKAIKWIRWIKYIAPLVATSNKLRENACDLLKKYRQRREAVLAMKIRSILWKKMAPEERTNKAARGIQSMYRSYRVRKARWALALMEFNKDELAAIRVQTMLRKMLQRARARIRQRRAELKGLEAKERSVVSREGRMTMSPVERKRLYQLQDEMQSSKTKSLDRRLLIRPNTKFSVVWKSIFVICVLIEITDLAVNPILAKQKVKGKPVTFSTKLEGMLIPETLSSLKACSCFVRERKEFNSWILARARPTRCPSDPWFCRPPFSTAQSVYSTVIQFIINHFMMIVGIICFLDVPIYHYTGELCGETGSLIPKGFFDRWIAPGLLLQLLVNPEMESTSKILFNLGIGALKVGPIRVLRWIEALFYPSLVLAVDFVEKRFWVPAVAHVNKNKFEQSPAEEEAPPAIRRRTSILRRASITDPRRSSLGYPSRRSSLNFHPRRSSLMPGRRSSSVLFAPQPRRSSCCFSSRPSVVDSKEKMM